MKIIKSVMNRVAIFTYILPSIIFPLVVNAQTVDIDPQGDSTCISLTSANLRYRTNDSKTNNEVSLLQDFLQSEGYLKSNPSGFFGILTLSAVKKFQSNNKISPTGYVGNFTKSKIKEISCNTASSTSVININEQIVDNKGVKTTQTTQTISDKVSNESIDRDPIVVTLSDLSDLTIGQNVKITWNSKPWTSYLITLRDENGYGKGTIATINSSSNSTSYNWYVGAVTTESDRGVIPINVEVNKKYNILVTDLVKGLSVLDKASNFFNILGLPIKDFAVTFPTQGTVLTAGETYKITWTGSDPNVTSYSVALNTPDGNYISTLGRADASQKYFSWTVPTNLIDGANYIISIGGQMDIGGKTPVFKIKNPVSEDVATSINRSLDIGYTGSDVTLLQKFLISKGYSVMGVDSVFGTFDQDTKNAVISYQQSINISPANGIVGIMTRSNINASLTASPIIN